MSKNDFYSKEVLEKLLNSIKKLPINFNENILSDISSFFETTNSYHIKNRIVLAINIIASQIRQTRRFISMPIRAFIEKEIEILNNKELSENDHSSFYYKSLFLTLLNLEPKEENWKILRFFENTSLDKNKGLIIDSVYESNNRKVKQCISDMRDFGLD